MLLEKILNKIPVEKSSFLKYVYEKIAKYSNYFLIYPKEYLRISGALSEIWKEASIGRIPQNYTGFIEPDPYKYRIIRAGLPLEGVYKYNENFEEGTLSGRICLNYRAIKNMSDYWLRHLIKHESTHRIVLKLYGSLWHDANWFRVFEELGENAPCVYVRCTKCCKESYYENPSDAKKYIGILMSIATLKPGYRSLLEIYGDYLKMHKCFHKETDARIIPIVINEDRLGSVGMQKVVCDAVLTARILGIPLLSYSKKGVKIYSPPIYITKRR